jgi:hypothetical protein
VKRAITPCLCVLGTHHNTSTQDQLTCTYTHEHTYMRTHRSEKGTPLNNRRQSATELANFERKITISRQNGPPQNAFQKLGSENALGGMGGGGTWTHNPSPSFPERSGRPASASQSFLQATAQATAPRRQQSARSHEDRESYREREMKREELERERPTVTATTTTSSPSSSTCKSPAKSASSRTDSSETHTRYTQLLMLVHGRAGDSWLHEKTVKKTPFRS